MHTHTCGELRASDIDKVVTLTGWVWHRRDHGGLIFVDLRDRDGVTQVSFDPEVCDARTFHVAETIRSEWPIMIVPRLRDAGLPWRTRTSRRGQKRVARISSM